MLDNPDLQWRELSETYEHMFDDELLRLAADYGDLTEIAQFTLGVEMKRRGLGDPASMDAAARARAVPNLALESAEKNAAENTPEYTWRTLLCQCKEWNEAWQVQQALQHAGIESWIEGTRGYDELHMGPRVVVPADQLEQARAILAQPIPQDIIDESKQEVPEYVGPVCPQCGAEDPILESAEPVNAWHCELCDKRWTDPASEPASAR